MKIINKFYILFVLSAFVGWVYEIIATYLVYGRYYDRGILHLPMCPIYGVGMILLYICLRKVKNVFALFLCSGLITTGIELAASYIIEYKFHYILWTYEGWPLNFQNRVSFISSMIFGLLAVVVFKIIKPLLDQIYEKHEKKLRIASLVGTLILASIQFLGMKGVFHVL